MDFYLFRHGETPFSKEGRAQGASNDIVNNGLTQAGKDVIAQNAVALRNEIGDVSLDKVYIYTTPLWRTYDTSQIIKEQLSVPENHLIINSGLRGRNYGPIEGMVEAEVRSVKGMMKRPTIALAYFLAQKGVRKNGKGIETKKDFRERVFGVLDDIFNRHEKDDVIILSVNSDVWDLIRKSELCSEVFDMSDKGRVKTGSYVKFQLSQSVQEKIDEFYATRPHIKKDVIM